MVQKPPQRVEATLPDSANAATFIFLHGLGDDADGWTNIAEQFQSASKLPYLSWVFPNAPFNQEAMSTAWYEPSDFSPIPVGRSTRESDEQFLDEKDDDEDADYDGVLKSVEYVCGLIDEEVKRGVDLKRIVVGGFSQGCAVSLVTGIASRYGGRVGGVVGLSGYLPWGKAIRNEADGFLVVGKQGVDGGKKGSMRIFLAHGTKDMLVPMRVYRDTKARLEKIVGESMLEAREYEGMGHVTSGAEFRNMCDFLEEIVPA